MINSGIKQTIIASSHELNTASNFDAASFKEFVYLVAKNNTPKSSKQKWARHSTI
ncbi:MAG: hypothetical protein GX963_10850 [Bacteroidales bacterium]|nr:hypothetical protein [Bacteroidales bacterium]